MLCFIFFNRLGTYISSKYIGMIFDILVEIIFLYQIYSFRTSLIQLKIEMIDTSRFFSCSKKKISFLGICLRDWVELIWWSRFFINLMRRKFFNFLKIVLSLTKIIIYFRGIHTKVSQSTYQLLTWCENDDVEKCHVKP